MKTETTVTLEIKITMECDHKNRFTAFNDVKYHIDHALKGAGGRIAQDDSMNHTREPVFGESGRCIGNFSMKTNRVED